MDGLDGSMLNIALPSIGKDLGVSSGSVIWIVSVYSITPAVSVLFFGRLGDITGKAKLYLAGIFVYMISTFLSGTAQTFPMLVVSRVIQEIGAGCTMANSQGIIAKREDGLPRFLFICCSAWTAFILAAACRGCRRL
jgi:MFS family permease